MSLGHARIEGGEVLSKAWVPRQNVTAQRGRGEGLRPGAWASRQNPTTAQEGGGCGGRGPIMPKSPAYAVPIFKFDHNLAISIIDFVTTV